MARQEHIVTLRIESVERLNSSVNGNPAWRITFDDGTTARTSSDASVSYEIGNPDRRAGSLVRVHFTAAGRIAYLSDPVDELGERYTANGYVKHERY